MTTAKGYFVDEKAQKENIVEFSILISSRQDC